jgi:hypothetical protein
MTWLRVILAVIGIIIFALLLIAGYLEAGSERAVRSYMGAVPYTGALT